MLRRMPWACVSAVLGFLLGLAASATWLDALLFGALPGLVLGLVSTRPIGRFLENTPWPIH